MSDTWVRETCPHCKKTNWVRLGDMEDMTVPDIEAVECYACDGHWLLDADNAADFDMGQGEWLTERGRRSPEDEYQSPKKAMPIKR